MKWQSYSLLGLAGVLGAADDVFQARSPSGTMVLSFSLSETGRPTYSLSLNDEEIIAPSGMGFEFFDFSDRAKPTIDKFYEGFEWINASNSLESFEVHEVWNPIWGEESEIRDDHVEMVARLVQTDTDRYLNIRFRVFDDGIGFRYEFPTQPNLIYYDVANERTQFVMTGDHMAWWIPADYDTQEYRYTYSRLSEIREKFDAAVDDDAIAGRFPFKVGVQTAFQMKADDGHYINIHEAALVNYSAMHLEIDDTDLTKLTLESHLTPDAVGVKAHLQSPNTSPWRTVIASKDARDILASRITYNLNEPATGDYSWVKPVKYMGVWWEMITGHRRWDYTKDLPSVQLGVTDYSKVEPHGKHGAENGNVKAYIDFAAEHGFDALLVEGWNIGWEDWFGQLKEYVFDFLTPYPDFDVEELRKYANDKGIRLLMHHETSGSTRNYERHLDRAYQFMNDHNYTSVKSGYVGYILPDGEHHYSQDIVNHYLMDVQKAAEYKICVNAHEAVRPTGLARTYPNMLANEAARGQEYQAFSGTQPSHVTILPFTRQIGGPMDYTPGIFNMDLLGWVDSEDEHDENWRVRSTIAHQLGLYVTMYSPLQMAADTYYNYEPHVDRAFQFIKDVPVDWEKSVYLEAEPGSYLTIARLDKANKQDWFIGNINGDTENFFDSKFTLDFLDADSCYNATIYQDTENSHYLDNPHEYDITSQFVQKDTEFELRSAPGGGYAIKVEKVAEGC